MNMKNRMLTLTGTLACLAGAPSHAAMVYSSNSCLSDYIDDLEACNNEFDNEDGDYGTHNNAAAYQACRDAAALNHESCLNGYDDNLFRDAFRDFMEDLESCLNAFPNESDREAREDCIAGALLEYRRTVEEIIDDQNNDNCSPEQIGLSFINPHYALQAAAQASGAPDDKYEAQANSTLSFSAGINPTSGQSYDTAQIPCLKNAIAVAVYRTKNGYFATAFDADSNTSDGTSINLHLIANELVHADDIHVITLFFDEQGAPTLAETSAVDIQDSPISGDWNRDEVLNSQDMIDFLDSYDAQTKRADLNNDDQVNTEDAQEFTESVND